MKTLDLLWSLQEYYSKLEGFRQEENILKNDEEIKILVKELLGQEKDIGQLESNIKDRKKSLQKLQSKLLDDEFRLKDLEENMYNGTVEDLKQLEYMEKESRTLRESISDLETNILDLMEVNEDLLKDMDEKKVDFNKGKKKYTLSLQRQNKNIKQVKKKVEDIQEKINKQESLIEKKHLKKYLGIKNSKNGLGIVRVVNGRCEGCNISLPTSTLELLKSNNDVYLCENCARILYYIAN